MGLRAEIAGSDGVYLLLANPIKMKSSNKTTKCIFIT